MRQNSFCGGRPYKKWQDKTRKSKWLRIIWTVSNGSASLKSPIPSSPCNTQRREGEEPCHHPVSATGGAHNPNPTSCRRNPINCWVKCKEHVAKCQGQDPTIWLQPMWEIPQAAMTRAGCSLRFQRRSAEFSIQVLSEQAKSP